MHCTGDESKMFVIFIIMVSVLEYVSCGEDPFLICQYEIMGLDDSITVSSSSDIGDSVYTLNIQEAGSVTTTTTEEPTTTTGVDEMDAKRRRRGEPMGYITGEHDIILDNGSSNFALTFYQNDEKHPEDHTEGDQDEMTEFGTTDKFRGLGPVAQADRSRPEMDPVLCRVCGEAFRNRSSLRQHELRHSKQSPYICCNKFFFSKATLQRHRCHQHAEVCSFICETCGKGFAIASDLRRHKAREAGVLKLTCDICGFKVESKGTLKDHTSIHMDTEDSKRHNCSICLSAFAFSLI